MAASLATLDVLEQTDGPAVMREMGQRFRDGVAAQAAAAGVGIRQSGPPQMPTILFDGDRDFARGERFTLEALKRGVYIESPPQYVSFDRAYCGGYRLRTRSDERGVRRPHYDVSWHGF